MKKSTTINAVVYEISIIHPHRDTIDISTGFVSTREFARYNMGKMQVHDLHSGEIIDNLPMPVGCECGDIVSITVEVQS